VDVHVAGLAEEVVLEVVVLEIGDGVDMFASPDRNGFSQITAPPRRMRDMPRTSAGRSPTRISGAEGGVPQLGMGEDRGS
jgi:hypothetical protein